VFEAWCAQRSETGELSLQPSSQIKQTLRRHGITHILVNWAEIQRYREPGSYGYTDFAHPDWFVRLQTAGVLGSALPLPDDASFMPIHSDADLQRFKAWAPSLVVSVADRPGYRAVQVFPVQPESGAQPGIIQGNR
jgi:hypothetical protein